MLLAMYHTGKKREQTRDLKRKKKNKITKNLLEGDSNLVFYTAVFSVVTQRSSPLTAAENRTTFLSLCVCGLTNKPIMYKKLDNT